MLIRSIFCIPLLLLSGCITTRSSLQAEQEKHEQLKERAEFENRLVEVSDETRTTLGRLEILERRIADSELQDKSAKEQKSEEFKKQNEKMDLLVESVSKLEEKLVKLNQEFTECRAEQARLSAAVQNAKEREKEKEKDPKKDHYKDADLDFEKGQWKEAALGYQYYREKNPKGKFYARATYQMGLCFEKLKLMDEAKSFFEEITVRFPKSKYFELAQVKLKKIKK